MQLLKFGRGNAKLGKEVYTFSLPAGYTCPNANICLSKANRETGKITDGKHTQFRCYAASAEALYSNVRDSRWRNLSLIKGKTANEIAELIIKSIPKKAMIVRVNQSGDMFSEEYFLAWINVAQHFPERKFYFYTKMISFWIKYKDLIGDGYKPGTVPNIIPTASYGGNQDNLIESARLRSARVLYYKHEAKPLGLKFDHTDKKAQRFGPDFALIIHGINPKGSEAAKANGRHKNGYSREKRFSLTLV